jgi:transposase, IS5 family
MAQMGFFDLSDCYASLDAKNDPLTEINEIVPWEEFRPLLEQVWRKPDSEKKSRAGRKPMDAVLMFNVPSFFSSKRIWRTGSLFTLFARFV